MKPHYWVALVVAGCSHPSPPPPKSNALPAPPPPSESLALPVSAGVSVWFGDSRADQDESGQGCRERVLMIHRDATRIPVPLLYTATVPILVDDSTIEAELWLHCKVLDRYRVNLTTGHPTRIAR